MWGDLAAMLASDAESTSDAAARAARYTAVAELYETELGDLPRAIEHYRRALLAAAGYVPAERALERLYTVTEDWLSLLSLLEERLERGGAEEPVGQLLEMAQLAEGRAGDLERAAGYLRMALAARPGDPQILRTLARIYADTRDFERLLEVLDAEVEQLPVGERRRSLGLQAAELCELRLDRIEHAEERYRALMQQYPGDEATLRALGRVLHRRGEWGGLIELYRQTLQQPGLGDVDRALIHFRMAEIRRERLVAPAEAVADYQRAAELHPTFRPALEALAQLYRQQGEWQALVGVLQRQARLLPPGASKAALLQAIGGLWEAQLGTPARAIDFYREACELSPTYEPAREALLRLLLAEERTEEAIAIYRRALEQEPEAGSRIALLKSLADVLERRAGDDARAIECYEQVLERSRDDAESLDALARLYERSARYAELVDIYERISNATEDKGYAVGCLYEAASIVELHLAPDHDVAPIYRRIVELKPDERPALDALAQVYMTASDHEGVAAALERRLALVDDARDRAALLLRLAGAREMAGDLAGAAEAADEAAQLGQDWTAARELHRLREQLGQWEEAGAALVRQAALHRDSELSVVELMRVASLFEERFADVDRAAIALERVLEIDPYQEEAASRPRAAARQPWRVGAADRDRSCASARERRQR